MPTTDACDARTDRSSAHRNLPRQDDAVTRPSEILFIDPAVPDIDVLLSGVRSGVEAIVLDAERPAARQMADVLAGHRCLDAVHVVAHGAPGRVKFASGEWSMATLAEQADDLAAIGEALGERGGLRLWSCHAGAGASGAAFTGGLAKVTGTAVDASIGRVGAADRHGAWQLAARTSAVAARPPLTAAGVASYPGVFDVNDYIEVSGTLAFQASPTVNFYFVVVNNVVVGEFEVPSGTLNPSGSTFDLNVEVSSAGPITIADIYNTTGGLAPATWAVGGPSRFPGRHGCHRLNRRHGLDWCNRRHRFDRTNGRHRCDRLDGCDRRYRCHGFDRCHWFDWCHGFDRGDWFNRCHRLDRGDGRHRCDRIDGRDG